MATAPNTPGPGASAGKDPGEHEKHVPRWVGAASSLLVVAAVVQVIASVMAGIYAVSPERLVIIQSQIDGMSGTGPSVESLRNMGVITVVLAGLGTVAAYLVLAFFLRQGRSWARVAAGMLVVLTLTQLVGISFPSGLTTVAQIILGALAVGMCYLPGSKRYFAVQPPTKR